METLFESEKKETLRGLKKQLKRRITELKNGTNPNDDTLTRGARLEFIEELEAWQHKIKTQGLTKISDLGDLAAAEHAETYQKVMSVLEEVRKSDPASVEGFEVFNWNDMERIQQANEYRMARDPDYFDLITNHKIRIEEVPSTSNQYTTSTECSDKKADPTQSKKQAQFSGMKKGLQKWLNTESAESKSAIKKSKDQNSG